MWVHNYIVYTVHTYISCYFSLFKHCNQYSRVQWKEKLFKGTYFGAQNNTLRKRLIFNLPTGSLDSKRDNVSSIYRVFELKMHNIKCICIFIGNGHLTIDSWIWLKVTSLSSTASVLKNGRISLEISSLYSKNKFSKHLK